MDSSGNNKVRNAIYALVITVVYMACSYVFATLYLVYDDCAMRSIAAGDMTGIPDGHIMFMNYAVGALLAILYGISMAFDWYSVFYLASITLALWAFLYKCLNLSERFGRIRRVLLTVISIVLFIFLFHTLIVKMTYTTVASILAVVVLFYYALTDEIGFSDGLILTLLSLICFAIRYETFLMFSPYVFMIIVYKLFRSSDRLSFLRRSIPLWLAILCGVGILYMVDKTAYNGEYSDIRELNYYRSEIQDKDGLPSYDDHEGLYASLGISREEYRMMGVCWGLCEGFTLENMKAIAEAADHDEVTPATICKDIKISITDNLSLEYKNIFCLLLVTAFALVISGKDIPYMLLLVTSLLTSAAECVYILVLRRTLDDRLIYSFSLAVLIQCIVYIYRSIAERGTENSFKLCDKVGMAVVSVALIFSCLSIVISCRDEARGRGWMYAMESYYMSDPDTLYLTSGWRSEEKIKIRRPFRRNYIKLNGWVTEMPQFSTSIAGLYLNAPDGLAYRDDIVLVCSEEEINTILDYMKQMGYNDISASKEDVEIHGVDFEFWRIDR